MALIREKSPDGNTYLGPVNSWRALGMCIVKQAMIDWHRGVLAHADPRRDTREAKRNKDSAERFLLSPWCEFYSGLDGKTLLRKMKDGSCWR